MIELPTLNGRRFVRGWAHTLAGQRLLEELLDRGYVLDPPPVSGGARDFDGTNDKIDRGVDDASLDVGNSTSLALQSLAWTDVLDSGNHMLAGKKNTLVAGDAGYTVTINTSNVLMFTASDGVDRVDSATFSPSINTWYAFTGYLRANAAANDDAGLYADFTSVGENNSTLIGSLANALWFRAGCAGTTGTPTRFWNGRIAYTRMWTKSGAWTASELNWIVESQNRLVLPAGAGPGTMQIQWVLWDAGSPTTTKDLSGNGLDGTYTETAEIADPNRVVGPGGMPWKVGRTAAAVVRHRRTLLGVGR